MNYSLAYMNMLLQNTKGQVRKKGINGKLDRSPHIISNYVWFESSFETVADPQVAQQAQIILCAPPPPH